MAKLNSAKTAVTVEKGDTLSEIARDFSSYSGGKTYKELAEFNDIPNPNLIYVGQVIKLTGTATTSTTNNSSKVVIKQFGLQSNTDRTVFATWSWDKSNTDHYQVRWYYATGDGVAFIGSDTTVDLKQSVYTAPENAIKVKVLIKPISKKHTVNNKETSYWTASWSTEKIYNFSNNPPSTPPVPNVSIEKYKLTAELSNLDLNATTIEFQVVKNDKTKFKTGKGTINNTNYVSYSCTVTAGCEYKVRCRAIRGELYSDWSEYSANVNTIPAVPSGITKCEARSETAVYLEWESVKSATSYDIEYTTKKEYFDSSDQTTTKTGIEVTNYHVIGLETGEEYFFRVRAVNDKGASGWSSISSIIIGKAPAAPTTWSSTTTAISGDPLTLYWVHNAVDGSTQTYAQIELNIGGSVTTLNIQNTSSDEEHQTSFYSIDTSKYSEGTKIIWRVRTRGITVTYSDWSVQRTVDIYAPPTLDLEVTDSNGDAINTLRSFPFYISGIAGPNTQTPIGYQVVITSNDTYDTVDSVGNETVVVAGSEVYSRYFDITTSLLMELSANNVNLENNVNYTITCTVSMDSGLTAEASSELLVAWSDEEYWPNAEIGYDEDTYTTFIKPYCEDNSGKLVSDITLSVYRREFDGSFTELGTGISNNANTFITDPHPALDYARYRVIAISNATGAVSYYDVPGYPIGEKAVIIQWDEAWSEFDTTSEEALSEPSWAGSLLRLPYNIDVSDKHAADVELVEYIGRKHPVGYYGTQLGETSTWNVAIDKSDEQTLYALRRLAIWMGDVYVREPSGSGYWANVSVSFSQKHRELTIPVTLEITRVEGGS